MELQSGCRALQSVLQSVAECCRVLQGVAERCSMLQRVAACCSVLQRVAKGPERFIASSCSCTISCRLESMFPNLLPTPDKPPVAQSVAECCSVLQCVAVCCSVLRCVRYCCRMWQCVAGKRSIQCFKISLPTPISPLWSTHTHTHTHTHTSRYA